MYKMIGADGQVYGPYSLEQLQDFVSQGRVTNKTVIILENGHRLTADQVLNFNSNSNNVPYQNNPYNYSNNDKKKNMFEYVKICFSKYCDFSGRARRSEYWFFVLFIYIINVVLGIIAKIMADGDVEAYQGICLIYCIPFVLVFLLPSLGVGVRRLHDVGKSGWNLLWALTGIGSIYLIILHCQDSEAGTNKWGPNPKA